MNYFTRKDTRLHVENVALDRIADAYGTPCYVYSRAAMEAAYLSYDRALARRDHLICYAVKANSSLAILNVLARMGSGFDIVSGGELERVIQAGGDPGKTVFSGVGKSESDMRQALSAGIENLNLPNQGMPEHTAGLVQWAFDGGTGKLSWPALLRKLDRENPGYDA